MDHIRDTVEELREAVLFAHSRHSGASTSFFDLSNISELTNSQAPRYSQISWPDNESSRVRPRARTMSSSAHGESRMQLEDLVDSSTGCDADPSTKRSITSSTASHHSTRELKLEAKLRESELAVLQWQGAYQDQVTTTNRLRDQRDMLMEDHDAPIDHKAGCESSVFTHTCSDTSSLMNELENKLRYQEEEYELQRRRWELEKWEMQENANELYEIGRESLKAVHVAQDEMHEQERMTKCHQREITRRLMEETVALLLIAKRLTKAAKDGQGVESKAMQPRTVMKVLKRLKKVMDRLEDTATAA